MSAAVQVALFPGNGGYSVTITRDGRTAVIQLPGTAHPVSAGLYIKGTAQAEALIRAALAARDLLTAAQGSTS